MPEQAQINNSPVDVSSLRGRSIIITGGASGLGEATSIQFAANGAYVTIADVQDDLGESLVKKITSDGGKASYVHCDVSNWDSSVSAFKHAVNFGPNKTLDVAVLYAGVVAERKNIVDIVLDGGDASLNTDPSPPSTKPIEINLTGVYYSAFLALNYFRLQPSASSDSNTKPSKADKSLIFISSLAGYTDYPPNSVYCASKFGVRGLFRSARSHGSKLGVRMNLIAPWFIQTPQTLFMQDELKAQGIESGKGFTFASKEYVVDAVGHCAVSDSDGRAYAIIPEGWQDLQDDLETGHGGDVLRDLIKRRMDAGDKLL